jgi:hypothetical protein
LILWQIFETLDPVLLFTGAKERVSLGSTNGSFAFLSSFFGIP